MTVIAFLLVVFGVKLVVALLIRLFSRKYHRGVIGFMDGLGGLLFGGVRGIIYVLLLFALLIPVLGVIWPGVSEWVSQAIDQGQLANLLYNNNVLLILVRDLFS
jgi:hypothetical protein